MNDPVEHVAMALAETAASSSRKEKAHAAFRATLEAIREPTKKQVKAGNEKIKSRDVYRAMIDQLIKELADD